MRYVHKIGFIVVSLLSIVSLVNAQDACPTTVDEAILALNDICFSVGRNQACYGNGDIVAIPQSGVNINFGVPGDTAIVDDIESMSLSPYDMGVDDWGIALLVLQADLPDTLPGQNVTMLLFGDVSLANDGGAYYFTSGIGTPSCNQAPNGVLIQTPEGVGEVNLTMNGINIALGSTAYLGTLEEDILTFALLEGNSTLSIDGSEVELVTEEFTTIELDEEGNAMGEFTEPTPIEDLELPTLPTLLLPEDIDAESTDDADSASASGDEIVPLSGNWTSSLGEFVFEGNCPAMFTDAMTQSLESFGVATTMTQVLDFEDGLNSFEEIFNTAEMQAAGLNYSFEQTEPNVYTMSFGISEEGTSISVEYVWRIVSETLMEGDIVESFVVEGFANCNVSTTFTYEYAG